MKFAFLIAVACLLISCREEVAYTLYRNSVIDEKMRIHVATFDVADGNDYNNENCALAQKLFQNQPGIRTRFWCEKGRFKK